jgi:hypothetical protein
MKVISVVDHTYNPSIREPEADESRVQSHLGQCSEVLSQKKKKKWYEIQIYSGFEKSMEEKFQISLDS